MRHMQCFLLFMGTTAAFAMRVNLSVAIVAMTDETTNSAFPTYNWDVKIKSYVLSSFFLGYVVTQIPAGYLAAKFGGKRTLFFGMFISSLTTLTIPFAANIGNWMLVAALRSLVGISQGMLMPSAHTILAKWAPIEERSIMVIYTYSGSQLGTVVMLATSGILASSSLGWPSIFYLPGIFGLFFSLAWYLWGASNPDECKFISIEEREFIDNSISKTTDNTGGQKRHKLPLKKIFTSLPFYALLSCHCSFTWVFWTLLTQIPEYMKSVLHMDIKKNALLSSLPYLAKLILGFCLASVANLFTKHKLMSISSSRKFFNTIGLWIPAIMLILLGFIDNNHPIAATIILTITVGVSSAVFLGFVVNHIDLSPNFAGMLMSITNFAANINSFIAPLVVGHVITDVKDVSQWRIIFFIAAGYAFFGNLLFLCCGSAKVQPWNNPNEGATIVPTSEEDAIDIEMKSKEVDHSEKTSLQRLNELN